MRFIVGTYREIYMDMSHKKTKVYGVAGMLAGETAGDEIVWEGLRFKVQVDRMEHLGVSLPLEEEAQMRQKARDKIEAVLKLWKEEEDIPLEVMLQQFRAEVVGALSYS